MVKNAIELMCELPRAASLQQICDLSYRILGNPVFISDLAHTILSYTKCVEIDDAVWQESIVRSRLERTTLEQDREVSAVHSGSAGEHRPILVEDGFMPYPRIIKTLVSRGQAVGVMVLTAYCTPFQPEDINVFDLISSFVLPLVAEANYFIYDDRQSVENYFIKLISGDVTDARQVQERLELLDWHPAPRTYLLSIYMEHGASHSGRDTVEPILLALRRMGCLVFMYNAALVCIYGSAGDVTDWPGQAPALAELLRQEGLMAGVSRRIRGFEALGEYYSQARDALELGAALGRSGRFFRYDTLSAFSMLRRLPEKDLSLFCHEKIQELRAYDTAHKTELCATLQVYLEQAKSLAKTAELLYIHRNTVRYRIKKCMELLNSDLEDGNEIFAYILSLRIVEFRRKFHGADVKNDKEQHYEGKDI